jgi:hypothetical protein
VRRRATGVHHPLRNARVVEMHDLLAQVVIVEQRRTARADPQRMVGLAQRHTLRGGQVSPGLGVERLRGPDVVPVGETGAGARWSGFGVGGVRGLVGSTSEGVSLPGTPGAAGAGLAAIDVS